MACGPCYYGCTDNNLSSCQVSPCHSHPRTRCHYLSPSTFDMKCTCPLGFHPVCPEDVDKDGRPRWLKRIKPSGDANSFKEFDGDGDDDGYDDGEDDDEEDKNQIAGTNCFKCVDTCFSFGCLNDGNCRHRKATFEPYCECRGPFRGKLCHVQCRSCLSSGTGERFRFLLSRPSSQWWDSLWEQLKK